MSPEQQRIAIAEACGWREINRASFPHGGWSARAPKGFGWGFVPDYLNNPNAMNNAEKMLGVEQQSDYGEMLTSLVPYTANSVHRDIFKMAHTTAAQRAEAFLKTIGKWEE